MDTAPITNTIIVPPVLPIIEPKRLITKVAINRILNDHKSKCQMVVREFNTPELLSSSLYIGRNWNKLSLGITIDPKVKSTLQQHYNRLIQSEEFYLKQIRDYIPQILSEFTSFLKRFNIEYTFGTTYSHPTYHLQNMLTLANVSNIILEKRFERLSIITIEINGTIKEFLNKVESSINDEARRLNSIRPELTRTTRTGLLESFADSKIRELIKIREDFKKRFIEMYEGFKNEKIEEKIDELNITENL